MARYEIYTLAELRNFYQQLTTTEGNSLKLQGNDLKNQLKKKKIKQKLKTFQIYLNFSCPQIAYYTFTKRW